MVRLVRLDGGVGGGVVERIVGVGVGVGGEGGVGEGRVPGVSFGHRDDVTTLERFVKEDGLNTKSRVKVDLAFVLCPLSFE